MQAHLLAINDEHWYKENPKGVFLPSASTILGQLKDGLEFVSAYDLKKAQERGIKVHSATEALEKGETLSVEYYSTEEWKMLMGFVAWHKEHKPKVLLSETPLASKKLGFGGTPDRVYLIGNEVHLVDIKTTSAIYPKHWLQVAAYRKLVLEKMKSIPEIHKTAILRLTAKTKSGYQYEESTDFASEFSAFQNLLGVWKHLHPDSQPKVEVLPPVLSL